MTNIDFHLNFIYRFYHIVNTKKRYGENSPTICCGLSDIYNMLTRLGACVI